MTAPAAPGDRTSGGLVEQRRPKARVDQEGKGEKASTTRLDHLDAKSGPESFGGVWGRILGSGVWGRTNHYGFEGPKGCLEHLGRPLWRDTGDLPTELGRSQSSHAETNHTQSVDNL